MSNVLDDYLADFKNKCDWALRTYYDAESLYNENHMRGFSLDMKNMIVENAFLNVVTLWESFLENTFIAYMMGHISENGVSVNRYVNPTDRDHAYNLIKNVTTYPDWTDLDKILINAQNFFENGGPFQILRTLKGELNAIKKIRNAIAHTSYSAKKDFENLVRGKVGYLPTDISPVKFISEHKTGKKRGDPTYFEHYVEFLKDTASILVEYKGDI